MSDFKKVDRKKRKNDSTNNKVEDLELRNYLVKKLKTSAEEDEVKNIVMQPEQEIELINITNNGKSKIKKLVTQGLNSLQSVQKITMQAKDKSISKLISVVEIIKQTLGRNNIRQTNHIFNMQDQTFQKQAFMKISLIYSQPNQAASIPIQNA